MYPTALQGVFVRNHMGARARADAEFRDEALARVPGHELRGKCSGRLAGLLLLT